MSEEKGNNPPRSVSAIDPKSIRIGSHPPATKNSTPLISTSPETQEPSPVAHHPENPPGNRLLDALWRSPDLCHQLGTLDRQNHRFKNLPVDGTADAIKQALKLSSEGKEVYFACAEYLTPDSRESANAYGARAFWMDIDCGEDKAAAGKGYPTIKAARYALRKSCKDTGLPKPTHIVTSGGGLHVYWVLDSAISVEQWQYYARKLKALTKACGFMADDSRTADIASVLRVPGTLNHKYRPPRPVSLKYASDEFIECSVMLDAITDAHVRLCSAVMATSTSQSTIATNTGNITDSDDAIGYGPPDLEKLSSALGLLEPDCDEETWKLRRLAPLAMAARNHPSLNTDLRSLARSWSSGELTGKPSTAWTTPGGDGITGEQAFDAVWKRFHDGQYTGTPATLGTVYHDAKQVGWVDTTKSIETISKIDVKSIRISQSTTTEPGAQTLPEETVTAICAPITPQNDDEVIAKLAAMKTLAYDRVRLEYAKQMGCRPAILDGLVKAARSEDDESNNLPFPEVEPSPTPVDPEQLLNEISAAIRRFIVMDIEQADAAALWVALTWFIDVVEVAPLAMINAPEKSCGKSQLLDVMGRMSARSLPVSNVSTASLFRSLELWGPTLLIDEADTFIRENDELKGLINAGHTRANAFVLRVVGDNYEPKRFSVWGAKALAGISLEKHLPDSTMSRAIVFNLRRKLPHESVKRLRHAEPGLFVGIASKLSRFADDYAQQVRRARPDVPDELSDRAQDNWDPMLAIAACAGPDWVRRATAAALQLSLSNEERVSTGNELLEDIRHVFDSKQVEKIKTADLIAALVEDDEKSWATYNRGKQLTPRQLAKLLAGYGIKSKTVRFGGSTPKGYEASQFADAFARYLPDPGNLPQRRNDLPESNDGEAERVADAESVAATPIPEETQEFTRIPGCGDVADVSGDADGADAGHLRPLSKPEDLF